MLKKQSNEIKEENSSKDIPNKFKIINIVSNNQAYSFKGAYNSLLLEDIISNAEFQKLVLSFTKLAGKSIKKKRLNDKIAIPIKLKIICGVSFIFAFLYILMMAQADPNTDSGTVYLLLGIVFFFLNLVLLFALSVYNFYREEKTFVPFNEIMNTMFNEYLIELNDKYAGLLDFKYSRTKKEVIISIRVLSEEDRKNMKQKNRKSINDSNQSDLSKVNDSSMVKEDKSNENIISQFRQKNKNKSSKNQNPIKNLKDKQKVEVDDSARKINDESSRFN